MSFFDLSGKPLPDDSDSTGGLLDEVGGPFVVDKTIRQAILYTWMLLPKERRTPEIVESEIRRIVDRATKEFRDDFNAFNTK